MRALEAPTELILWLVSTMSDLAPYALNFEMPSSSEDSDVELDEKKAEDAPEPEEGDVSEFDDILPQAHPLLTKGETSVSLVVGKG